jgi:hypothetical protein
MKIEGTTGAVKEQRLPGGFSSAQLHEEANHEGGEQSQTGNTTNLGNELGQVVQLLLQRSRIGISPESCRMSGVISNHGSGESNFQRTHPS